MKYILIYDEQKNHVEIPYSQYNQDYMKAVNGIVFERCGVPEVVIDTFEEENAPEELKELSEEELWEALCEKGWAKLSSDERKAYQKLKKVYG